MEAPASTRSHIARHGGDVSRTPKLMGTCPARRARVAPLPKQIMGNPERPLADTLGRRGATRLWRLFLLL
jgi:hypothetical protein